jgi:hypothetical protein
MKERRENKERGRMLKKVWRILIINKLVKLSDIKLVQIAPSHTNPLQRRISAVSWTQTTSYPQPFSTSRTCFKTHLWSSRRFKNGKCSNPQKVPSPPSITWKTGYISRYRIITWQYSPGRRPERSWVGDRQKGNERRASAEGVYMARSHQFRESLLGGGTF